MTPGAISMIEVRHQSSLARPGYSFASVIADPNVSQCLDELYQRGRRIDTQLCRFRPHVPGGEHLLHLADVNVKPIDRVGEALLGLAAAAVRVSLRDVAAHALERIDQRFVADECEKGR